MSVSPPCCCGRCCCYTTASRVRGIERWEGRAVTESEPHTKQKFNKTHMNIKLNTKDMQIFIYHSLFFRLYPPFAVFSYSAITFMIIGWEILVALRFFYRFRYYFLFSLYISRYTVYECDMCDHVLNV